MSNSKPKFSNNRIGNAAVLNDNKPGFLRCFAKWLKEWENSRIPNFKKFTFSHQTSSALQRTLLCHASLIEDLLDEGYDFVLTSRFQSDPIERRFGQYRQMSGGRFLVNLKDVTNSENILKIKSLIKEGIDLEELKEKENDSVDFELKLVEIDFSSIKLSDDLQEVANYIAGFVAKKLAKKLGKCCKSLLVAGGPTESNIYLNTLSRGGLITPTLSLSEYVGESFAMIDHAFDIIMHSGQKEGEMGC